MGRIGITKEDVFVAANQVLASGQKPTNDRIRKILGTGSFNTICKYLAEWKEHHPDTEALAPKDDNQAVKLYEATCKIEELEAEIDILKTQLISAQETQKIDFKGLLNTPGTRSDVAYIQTLYLQYIGYIRENADLKKLLQEAVDDIALLQDELDEIDGLPCMADEDR